MSDSTGIQPSETQCHINPFTNTHLLNFGIAAATQLVANVGAIANTGNASVRRVKPQSPEFSFGLGSDGFTDQRGTITAYWAAVNADGVLEVKGILNVRDATEAVVPHQYPKFPVLLRFNDSSIVGTPHTIQWFDDEYKHNWFVHKHELGT